MKKRKLIPLADRIVVRREEALDKTPGGILLPDQAKEKPVRGEVLAVGPGRPCESGENYIVVPVNLKVGDVVLFAKYAGNDVELDGEEYLILSEEDILATVKE